MNDAADLEYHVRQLQALGHRGSATLREEAAADLIAAELEAIGLRPEKICFPSHSSYGARLFLHVLSASCAMAAVLVNPYVATALSLITLASFLIETSTLTQLLSRLLPPENSRNVVARIDPSNGAPRARIVLCAHIDTQRSGMIWSPAAIKVYLKSLGQLPGPLKCPMLSLSIMLVLQCVLCAMLIERASFAEALYAVIAVSYAAMALFVGQWAFGAFVPGATDNASGVAAVVTLTERWLQQSVPDVQLVVLLSGSEEVGCLGTAAWLDSQYHELPSLPTCFLNVDTLGYGQTRFLGSECAISGLTIRYPEQYVGLCKELASGLGLKRAGPHSPPTQTDGLAFLARGIPGITVTTFEDGFVVPNDHQSTDTADEMDFQVVEQATEFAWSALQTISKLIAS